MIVFSSYVVQRMFMSITAIINCTDSQHMLTSAFHNWAFLINILCLLNKITLTGCCDFN